MSFDPATELPKARPLLTQVLRMPGGKRVPLMMEVPVARELDGPFLFVSARSFMWIERSFENGLVRTAVRKVSKETLFREVVERVAQLSLKREWGNVQAATKDGVTAAFSHLADYDIIAVEVLFGEGFDCDLLPDDIQESLVPWLPAGWAVVVPVDRSFLGTVFEFGGDQHGMVIHNAPRGIAIVKPSEG